MAEPTLQSVFGAGATQDATTITILKADLPGLTATAVNRAEQLWVGLFLKAVSYFTEAGQTSNPDQQITITDGFPPQSLVTRNSQQFRQNSYAVNLQKLDTSSVLDPDDF